MKINQSMTISDLQEMFKKDFEAKLVISTNIKSLNTELYEIAKIKDKYVSISVNKSTRTRSIEKMFMQQFGINVEVCDKWGNSVAKDVMISQINEEARQRGRLEEEEKDQTKKQGVETEVNEREGSKIVVLEKDVHSYVDKDEAKKEDPRIKNIKNAYMKYQKTEKYEDMRKLITLIEEAQMFSDIDGPFNNGNHELKKTISNVKIYAKNVASMYKHKRKFFISVIAAVAIIAAAGGLLVSVLERYRERQISLEIDDMIKTAQIERAQGGATDNELLMIKQKELNAIRSRGLKKDFLLIFGIISLVVTSIFVVKLNKYTVTSCHFD